ncbi:Nuclear cap-binding protein subunit 1 [Entomophthora muscae]|uniref:Nuclear cap-binding protein subunit 1 n=1 Tax=Entomophthora muscae TaxID=34485 RepID=A0ACC2UBN0_9FUNG|nr:Nuclear cap-binding protein subunit 1 [Entomophthora muscae]
MSHRGNYNGRGNRGGYHRGGGYRRDNGKQDYHPYNRYADNAPPPLSEEESLKARLNMLILKIGDKVTTSLEKNIETLAKVLIKDYSRYSESINQTLLTCIKELPSKTPIYSCLTALVIARNADIGSEVLNFLCKGFEQELFLGRWRSVKILLRFFGQLTSAKVLTSASMISYFTQILSPLASSIPKDQGDCLVQLVLGSLPWVAKTLSQQCPEDLIDLLELIEAYFKVRSSLSDLRSSILKVYPASMSADEHDFLDLLWIQTKECQVRDWEVPELLKPYLAFEDALSLATPTDLPSLIMPENLNDLHFDPPFMQFVVFPENEQFLCTMGYYIISDIINDSIDIFETNRRECVRLLFTLNEVFSENVFMPVLSEGNPNDMETDSAEAAIDKSVLPNLFYLITEAIFRKLFQLPKASNKCAYYGVLFFEAFKAMPKLFPGIFKKAVDSLFIRSKDMDVECIERFYTWFSQHLSNFDFKWNWEDWSCVLEADKFDLQRIIVKECLGKLIRLSYYDRIKTTIPESFMAVFPARAPEPLFSFTAPPEDAPFKKFCTTILDAFRHKKPVDEILRLVKDVTDELDDEFIVKQISVETLLLLGSKSISHMMNIIEKFLPIFQFFTHESEDKDEIIKISANFWRESPQWLGLQLDKFLNYHIVEPINIVDWVFSESNKEDMSSAFLWEVLYNTLNKLILWVGQQKNSYESASNKDDLTSVSLLELSNNAQSDLRKCIIAIFQHFVAHISNLLETLDSQGEIPEKNLKYLYLVGRMREFGRRYQDVIKPNMESIETIAFDSMDDVRIQQVFEEIKSLQESPLLEK